METLKNIHPGEVLASEFLRELGISQNQCARDIRLSPRAVGQIARGERSITADSALRFGRYFGTTPRFWLNLQAAYDLEEAAKKVNLRDIRQFRAA